MGVVYIVVMIFVILFLIGLPLFPFWKVVRRIKSHHPDLWDAKGPFDLRNMTAHPALFRSLLDVVSLADKDEVLRARDPELIKWCRIARETWKMMPRSFIGQIGAVFILIYFIIFFTSIIAQAFA